jgi:hypothetical protein
MYLSTSSLSEAVKGITLIDKAYRWAAAPVLGVWLATWILLSWAGVQDDAFIHLRYADNLFELISSPTMACILTTVPPVFFTSACWRSFARSPPHRTFRVSFQAVPTSCLQPVYWSSSSDRSLDTRLWLGSSD